MTILQHSLKNYIFRQFTIPFNEFKILIIFFDKIITTFIFTCLKLVDTVSVDISKLKYKIIRSIDNLFSLLKIEIIFLHSLKLNKQITYLY